MTLSIPMKESESAPSECFYIEDPEGVVKMVGRLTGDTYKKILQAKHEKADLEKVMNKSPQRNSQQKRVD